MTLNMASLPLDREDGFREGGFKIRLTVRFSSLFECE